MEPHHIHHRRLRAKRAVRALPKRVEVVTDVVYVTASPTFGGKVVGFTTLGEAVVSTPSPSPAPQPKVTSKPVTPVPPATSKPATPKPATTTATPETPKASSTEPEKTTRAEPSSVTSGTLSVEPPSTTQPTSATDAAVTTSESLVESSFGFSPSQTSLAPTASSTLVPAETGRVSTGGAVGLGLAGFLVFVFLCSAIAWVYRKRSQRKAQEAYGKTEDEKAGESAAHGGIYLDRSNNVSRTNTITSEKAPRVPSLRPVTQFLPYLTVTPPATTLQPSTQQQQQPQQRVTPIPSPQSGLVRSESRKAPPPSLVLSKRDDIDTSAPPSATTINSTAPLITRSQPSPTTSTSTGEFSNSGDSVVGSPVVAAASNSSPVHRVQMDFRPSMGDELELRVGGLVRMLHEYDDGWALCIRLDRSQQGVCPRTCLSQRPVKPRPQGPVPGVRGSPRPNGHPQSPAGNRGPSRPYSPAGGPRVQSPGLNGTQFPHPGNQSPVASHPQSPGGHYVKPQYRPATPTQEAQLRIIPVVSGQQKRASKSPVTQSPVPQSPVPQSPVTQNAPVVLRVGPQITMTTDIPDAGPATPTSATPKSPTLSGSPPRPAVAPARPSPLSNEQSTAVEPEPTQPVFHAM